MTDHTHPEHPERDDMDEIDDIDDIDAEIEGDDATDLDEADEIELIVTYLQGKLDPARAAEVKQRLDEDPAFYELAWPLILAWSVPPRHKRVPRPEGEFEREWEKFVKRTGFPLRPADPPPPPPAPPPAPTPRRRDWRRWLAVAVLAVAGVVAITVVAQRGAGDAPAISPEVAAKLAADSMSAVVPYSPDWITLENGIDVKLAPDAQLRVAHQRLRGMRHLLLTGIAQFRVPELDSAGTPMRTQALILQTSVGYLTASASEFSVIASTDTTFVHVHALPANGRIPPSPMTLSPVLEPADLEQLLVIKTPIDARLVRGRNPARVSTQPTIH